MAVICLALQYGHIKIFLTSLVSTTRSHFPHLAQIKRCLVFASLAFTRSIIPLSRFAGAA